MPASAGAPRSSLAGVVKVAFASSPTPEPELSALFSLFPFCTLSSCGAVFSEEEAGGSEALRLKIMSVASVLENSIPAKEIERLCPASPSRRITSFAVRVARLPDS